MKSQLSKKEIQELKESGQILKEIKKENFKSRHKIEQNHLYFHQNSTEQSSPIIKSRRKKS